MTTMIMPNLETNYCFQDLANNCYKSTISSHIDGTLNLLSTLSNFTQSLANCYKLFSSNLTRIALEYREMPLNSACSQNFNQLWISLLNCVEEESADYSVLSERMVETVRDVLAKEVGHKTKMLDKLFNLRASLDEVLASASNKITDAYSEYIGAYNRQRVKYESKTIPPLLSAHNNYLLQLKAANNMKEIYYSSILPYCLDELENVQSNLIISASLGLEDLFSLIIAKHKKSKLINVKGLEMSKNLDAKKEISEFVKLNNPNKTVLYWRHEEIMAPDEDCPEIFLREEIIDDKLTSLELHKKMEALKKEFFEVNSLRKQNEDIIQSLTNMFPGSNVDSNFNMQDDIFRKQIEVKLAEIQLAGLDAKIKLINSKKPVAPANVKDDDTSASLKKFWKKAVLSLRRENREKPIKKFSSNAANSAAATKTKKSSRYPHLITLSTSHGTTTMPALSGMTGSGGGVGGSGIGGSGGTIGANRLLLNQPEQHQNVDPVYDLLRCNIEHKNAWSDNEVSTSPEPNQRRSLIPNFLSNSRHKSSASAAPGKRKSYNVPAGASSHATGSSANKKLYSKLKHERSKSVSFEEIHLNHQMQMQHQFLKNQQQQQHHQQQQQHKKKSVSQQTSKNNNIASNVHYSGGAAAMGAFGGGGGDTFNLAVSVGSALANQSPITNSSAMASAVNFASNRALMFDRAMTGYGSTGSGRSSFVPEMLGSRIDFDFNRSGSTTMTNTASNFLLPKHIKMMQMRRQIIWSRRKSSSDQFEHASSSNVTSSVNVAGTASSTSPTFRSPPLVKHGMGGGGGGGIDDFARNFDSAGNERPRDTVRPAKKNCCSHQIRINKDSSMSAAVAGDDDAALNTDNEEAVMNAAGIRSIDQKRTIRWNNAPRMGRRKMNDFTVIDNDNDDDDDDDDDDEAEVEGDNMEDEEDELASLRKSNSFSEQSLNLCASKRLIPIYRTTSSTLKTSEPVMSFVLSRMHDNTNNS